MILGITLGLLLGIGGLFSLLCLLPRASGGGWLDYWRWLFGKD